VMGSIYTNVPVTDEEADRLFQQLIWFADPNLIKLVMKGDQAVGFFFAYPDISAAVRRTRGRVFPLGWLELLRESRRTRRVTLNAFGISEDYRGLGGTVLLINEVYKSIIAGGYQHLEFAQARADNQEMLREMEFLGLNYYKAHRIYERLL